MVRQALVIFMCQFLALVASHSHASSADVDGLKLSVDANVSQIIRTNQNIISFNFSSPSGQYNCSLDGAPFAACVSPYIVSDLKGVRSLMVRDYLGNSKEILFELNSHQK